MAGNVAGGLRAAKTNKKLYGKDHYQRIGAIGGSKTKAQGCKPKGFAKNPELARTAGRLGGHISKRRPSTYKAKAVKLEERKQEHKNLLDIFKLKRSTK